MNMFLKLKSKIANKLSFYIVLSIVLSFILIFLLSLSNAKHLIKTRIENELWVKTESASQTIWNIFENAILITEQMSFNNEIKDYLKTTTSYESITTNPLYPNVLQTLMNIQQSYHLNFLAWVSNEKANFYLDSNGVIPDRDYDVKTRPWYSTAISNEGVSFTTPYVEWGTKSIVISAIKSLKERNNIYGFVVVDMRLDSLPEIFAPIDVGERGAIFLVDSNGHYIYDRKQLKTLNHSIFDASDPLLPYASEIINQKKGFTEITINREAWYLSYRPATETGWVMISLINKKETENQLIRFTIQLIFIFIFAIVLLLIIVFVTIRNITLPIRVISAYGHQIANGDLDAIPPSIYANRLDEMGELSRSFITLTEVFQQQNKLLSDNLSEKNSELQLQYKYILETEKLTSLGYLVAGVSHEINTPLGIGLTSASYIDKITQKERNALLSGTMTKNSLMNYLDEMQEANELLLTNLERAAELVKNFKKISVDQTNEIKSKFNLNEHVYSIIISLKHEYKNRAITIVNNCPQDIDLDSYPGPLTQVFTNLIINSLRHGFSLTDTGNIQISAKSDTQFVYITYIDTGKGISPENLDKIFEPFFTTNRQQGNSGLGMFIVKNIVSQILGGSIECFSTPNQGVRFEITILKTM